MGEKTTIAWTTHTFNPWIGCQKVSPGCDFCYAEAMMDTRLGRVKWGPNGDRIRTSPVNWAQPLRWAKAAACENVRHRVFCASLGDWLDNRVPGFWRDDLAALIDATPELDWLLLTKRPENLNRFLPWTWRERISRRPPRNVWLGVTCEDQENFDRRYAILADMPATAHFVSYEPALGPLSISYGCPMLPDWIICGGESGPKARPFDIGWARSLRDQSARTGAAFFMKQVGSRPLGISGTTGKGDNPAEWPSDLRVREFPNPVASG